MKKILTIIIYAVFIVFTGKVKAQITSCFQINSILVDACAPSGLEGQNEMVSFQVGPQALNTSDMNVTWATASIQWLGVCQTSETAAKVAELNATIEACGWLLEPTNGILPANSKVILVTSVAMDVASNSFAGLTDTTYMLFHCGTSTTGHFANYMANGGTRTLSMSFANPAGCSQSVTYDRALLVNQNGQQGAADGATVNFDAQGNANYINNGCNAPFVPLSAAWTPPSNGNVCVNSFQLNLNAVVTGNPGGTWSGEGVNGIFFFPSGLNGPIEVTYTVTQGSCSVSETNIINVNPLPDATFSNPGPICSSAGPLNLNTLITGTPGGNFTGSGVVNNQLNPESLAGDVTITYTVVQLGCLSSSQQTINIIQTESAAWNAPNEVCQGAQINLDDLVTGAAGGTWSGSGVSGNILNTTGLTGAVVISYTIVSNDCDVVVTQSINIIQGGNASWNAPENICTSSSSIDFNTFITGDTGGNWIGSGISNAGIFNPSGLSGTISITYQIGSGECLSSQSNNIEIIDSPATPTVLGPVDYCQDETAAPLIASGISGGDFNWYSDAALTNLVFTGQTFEPSTGVSNGLYVTQDLNGCESAPFQVNINITPKPPTPIVPEEVAICEGTQTTINAEGAGLIGWYADPEISNLILAGNTFIIEQGAYEILYVVQILNNCTSDVAIVNIVEGENITALINPEGPISLCEGESITLTSNFNSGNLWSTSETTPSIVVDEPGNYSLTVTGICNTSVTTVNVNLITLNAEFSANPLEGLAPLTVNFSPEAVSQDCGWFINGVAEPSLNNGSFTFTTPGNYTVRRLCENEPCSEEKTIEITVNSGNVEFNVPNSFTPNGDNFNDFFKADGSGIESLNARIFNRWGQLIFEWEGFANGWDGNVNGVASPDGVYFFIIQAKDFAGNTLEKNGTVTLLR